MSSYESTDAFLTRKFKEEENIPEKMERIVDRIIHKLDLLEERMKTVETDLAYIYQPSSPEEQKIKDYLNK